jgi:hypothetical protein
MSRIFFSGSNPQLVVNLPQAEKGKSRDEVLPAIRETGYYDINEATPETIWRRNCFAASPINPSLLYHAF